LLLAFSLLTALLVVALPQASAASSISAKRAEARQVENQIMNQEAALEKQIEKYNAVHQHYLQTRHQLQNNRIVLAVARKNLAHAQRLLAQSLTSAYKSTDEDVVSFLLASHSFSELVDHVQVLQRANDANSNLIAQIAQTKKVIADRTRQLSTETAQLARDQRAQLAAKQHVEAGLHSLQARKSQISADIQHLIDQQQAREQAAATAAAAAASGAGAAWGPGIGAWAGSIVTSRITTRRCASGGSGEAMPPSRDRSNPAIARSTDEGVREAGGAAGSPGSGILLCSVIPAPSRDHLPLYEFAYQQEHEDRTERGAARHEVLEPLGFEHPRGVGLDQRDRAEHRQADRLLELGAGLEGRAQLA